jgi:hypothetical protein
MALSAKDFVIYFGKKSYVNQLVFLDIMVRTIYSQQLTTELLVLIFFTCQWYY